MEPWHDLMVQRFALLPFHGPVLVAGEIARLGARPSCCTSTLSILDAKEQFFGEAQDGAVHKLRRMT